MKYICVRCRQTWVLGKETEEASGGLCRPCITEYVQGKQGNNGLSPCFNNLDPDYSDCKRDKCSYYQLCLNNPEKLRSLVDQSLD